MHVQDYPLLLEVDCYFPSSGPALQSHLFAEKFADLWSPIFQLINLGHSQNLFVFKHKSTLLVKEWRALTHSAFSRPNELNRKVKSDISHGRNPRCIIIWPTLFLLLISNKWFNELSLYNFQLLVLIHLWRFLTYNSFSWLFLFCRPIEVSINKLGEFMVENKY